MKPFEQQTYYELLEIPVTAPEDEIRAAYERAIETYSPDSVAIYTLVDPGQIDALRARLTEAMEILTEPDLRAEYDRMIGVSRAEPSAVAALTPALAAAAQAGQTQEPSAAAPPAESQFASKPSEVPASPKPTPEAPSVPAVSSPVEAPAPATPAVQATPEPAPAPAVAPAEPAAPPAPVVPVAPLVMPGMVSPSQVHAAFRSYAISYVPVLVPASTPTGTAFVSPFAPVAQAGVPLPGPEASLEAKAPEAAASAAPATAPAPGGTSSVAPSQPAAEPAPAASPATVNTAEAPPVSTSATAPSPAITAEPAPGATVAAEPPQPETAQASAQPPPPEPVPAPAAPETSTPGPQASPASAPRGPKKTTTPPPVPPGSRRFPRGPGVQPAAPVGEAGKESARPGQPSGMNLEEAQQIAQESAIATAESALAQVSAKAREPRPKPIELPPHTEFNGELLRRVRESRGLTLSQLAERTRISSKHLENIEADRYAALPATVYLRGMIMSVARELTLDPLRVSRSYLALATAPNKK
jgi:hypothetical protein